MEQETFFAQLCGENETIHACGLSHSTVLGIGSGTLPESTFRFYIEQDYQFLSRYVRVLAQAVAASPDLPTATKLAELLHTTLAVEIDALIDLYGSFGGDPAALDAVTPAPTCQAYTDHLLATSAAGNLLVTLASILPCQWGYREIGRHLLAKGLPDDERYGRWIEEYASDEYTSLVDWLIERFNSLAESEGLLARQQARCAFGLSTRYEYAFWEMAANRQGWPAPQTGAE